MASRDLWMIGIGFAIGFFVFSAMGRRTVGVAAKYGKKEYEKGLTKLEERAK